MVTTPKTQSALASLWYCRIYGLERGPITWEMLQDLAQAGDLKPSDLVRRADLEGWVVASQARCIHALPHTEPSASRNDVAGTERLAAALAADAVSAHAPARSFRRKEAAAASAAPAACADHEQHDATIEQPMTASSVDASVEPRTGVSDCTVDAVESAKEEPSLQNELPASVVSGLAVAESLRQVELAVAHANSAEPPSDPAEVDAVAVVPAPIARRDAASIPAPLPAAAIARAVRESRPSNPGGLALLALGLALIGLFKLALPLGLLSLYLAWQSASDMRRRPLGMGLAVAAGAMIVASVDVGVSLYTIVNRL